MSEQPSPTPVTEDDERPVIVDLVVADLEERKRVGCQRYGQALRPFNGRRAIVDLYEELLDAAVYMRQELYEREVLTARVRELERENARLRTLIQPDDVDDA